jgi:hypothetical protein
MIWKALFGKREPPPMTTVAELRQAMEGLPDDMPVFVSADGAYGRVYISPRRNRPIQLVYNYRGWIREGEGSGETITAFAVE